MSKTFRIFQLQGLNLWLLFGNEVSHFRWGVSASWDLVKWWWYHLIFWHFFQILLIFDRLLTFLRCKDNWLFGTDAGLVHYGWKPWTLFPRVTIRVTTQITTFLREFCTVSKALLLLAYYYISYCMPYYTFSAKAVHICMVFNALPCLLPSIFCIKESICIFLKKLMVTRRNSENAWKIDN